MVGQRSACWLIGALIGGALCGCRDDGSGGSLVIVNNSGTASTGSGSSSGSSNTTFSLVKELVDEYAGKETPEYPLSGQVEWRASALDDGKYVGVPNSSPALTSGHVDPETIARTGWDVMLVIEVIYFPRTTGFNKFALELEERFNAHPLLSGDNDTGNVSLTLGLGCLLQQSDNPSIGLDSLDPATLTALFEGSDLSGDGVPELTVLTAVLDELLGGGQLDNLGLEEILTTDQLLALADEENPLSEILDPILGPILDLLGLGGLL